MGQTLGCLDNDVDDTLWASAANQQPAEHTACIAEGALLRDPFFTCVHTVVASTHDTRVPNKEFSQCCLATTYSTLTIQLSVFLDLLQSSLFSCFREAISSFSLSLVFSKAMPIISTCNQLHLCWQYNQLHCYVIKVYYNN